MSAATVSKIASAFPKAMPNGELVSKVATKLTKHGFNGKNTLVATSLCCDELSRPLEKCLGQQYGDHFTMGGLAGFPFGGVTSFGAMAAHIPDGGHCLLCFGPHVGVDSQGNVGTVERAGRANGGACCGSANAACSHVLAHMANPQDAPVVEDVVDKQQSLVGELLMPHASQLAAAEDVQIELPYALLEAQQKFVGNILGAAAPAVADGHIAVVGGIQINTPPGMEDYFWTKQFEVYNNSGEKIDELSLED